MYYCFVEEDLAGLCDEDPLMIQAKYAKRLGLYCCCCLSDETVSDQERQSMDLDSKCVFLRATCDSTMPAVNILLSHGAKLLENLDDIHIIENWDILPLAKRQLFSVRLEDVLRTSFSPEVRSFLSATPILFIKSRKKGFSAELPSKRLLELDFEIISLIKEHLTHPFQELMLSEKLEVKADSLGLKETRHFVFDGILANSSRPLHSVKHAIPRTLLDKAKTLVDVISAIEDFPKNYVIDVGEFMKNGDMFLDIIELNPITNALCYVNNSAFDDVVPEAFAFHRNTGMGAEYCYDAIENPSRYTQRLYSNARYTYKNDDHHSFL